jgi:hypothetical protein
MATNLKLQSGGGELACGSVARLELHESGTLRGLKSPARICWRTSLGAAAFPGPLHLLFPQLRLYVLKDQTPRVRVGDLLKRLHQAERLMGGDPARHLKDPSNKSDS